MAPRQFASPQTTEVTGQGYSNHKFIQNYVKDTTTETEQSNQDDIKDSQDDSETHKGEDVAGIQEPPEFNSSPQPPLTPQPLPASPMHLTLPVETTPLSPKPQPLPPHLQEIRPQQLLPPHLQEIHPVTTPPLDIENYLTLGKPVVPEAPPVEPIIEAPPNKNPDVEKSPVKRRITRPTMKPGRLRKGVTGKDLSKLENSKSPSLYPETLPPFDHPKEGMNKCLMNLENADWEMTIQGLQSVVRIARHHPSLLNPHTHIHTICVALARHIRNLRSQVARAACQASALLFSLLGRSLENDVEDIVCALFSRTADTNRFLRADCSHALDCMAENISPIRSIPAILSKGAKHQNAVVRTAACRLLVDLCNRMGAERVLLLPRDIRDGILNTGAKLLTEGSLDTRNYAKELFVILSKDNRLPTVLSEVIPNSLMRNISKTLSKIQNKKS